MIVDSPTIPYSSVHDNNSATMDMDLVENIAERGGGSSSLHDVSDVMRESPACHVLP